MVRLSAVERWILGICYLPAILGLPLGLQVLVGPLGSSGQGVELALQAAVALTALLAGAIFLSRPSDVSLAVASVMAFLSLIGTLVWRATAQEELLAAGLMRGAAAGTAILAIGSLLFLIGALRVLLRAIRSTT
jgi:hypothetical protein